MQPTSQAPIVQIFHISKSYKHNCQALNDITFEVQNGDFVFLTGPSGAGKTTLLKLIFVEEKPTNGEIIVLGRNLRRVRESNLYKLRRKVGVIFQDFRLIKNRTVFQNIDFVLRFYGQPRKVREKRIWHVLKMVGLEKKLDSYPLELSGGEQQRIAIARAIVNNPPLILADEPTGNLDPKKEEEIMALFEQINNDGATLIVATHNDSLIERMGKRVISLDKGRLVGFH